MTKRTNKASELSSTSPVRAPEVLSFLKDTKGTLTWTARDLADSLNLSKKGAEQVLAALELQGYVKPAQGSQGEWFTTPAGEVVSGSKSPRLTRASVEKALADLSDRIKTLNKDATAEFKVSQAVAFGDFLSDRPRIQAPDVGIGLARRDGAESETNSASDQSLKRRFLNQLRAGTALLSLQPYQAWMSHRSHRSLL